jgi:hypothetical protein
MSHERPAPDCADVVFPTPCALTPPAQVALEDYARVLTVARAAETIAAAPNDATTVRGVHLCGLDAPVTDAARRDVADFARELAANESSGGLGWS